MFGCHLHCPVCSHYSTTLSPYEGILKTGGFLVTWSQKRVHLNGIWVWIWQAILAKVIHHLLKLSTTNRYIPWKWGVWFLSVRYCHSFCRNILGKGEELTALITEVIQKRCCWGFLFCWKPCLLLKATISSTWSQVVHSFEFLEGESLGLIISRAWCSSYQQLVRIRKLSKRCHYSFSDYLLPVSHIKLEINALLPLMGFL